MNGLIRSQSFKPAPQRRDFYAGMAMAAPFVGSMIPYPWLFIALAAVVPFIIHIAYWGIRIPQRKSIPMIIWLVGLLAAIHIWGLWGGTTPYWFRTLGDMAIVAAGVFVFLTRHGRSHGSGGMFDGFIATLIPFAIAVGILGLVKAGLFERGYLLGFIYERYHDLYPSGSSLKDDYNAFSLSLLIASMGLVMNALKDVRSHSKILYNILGLAVLISAGMLTPSRRFAIASILIPVLWLTVGAVTIPKPEWFRRILLPIAGVVWAVLLIHTAIESPNQIGPEQIRDYQVIRSGNISKAESEDRFVNVGPAADRLFETFNKEHSYGFASRIDRLLFGKDLLVERAWLTGIGFSYHWEYSCRFGACTYMDYPHFPLLSEWLSGGIIAALVTMAIYFLLYRSLWRLGWHGWMTSITPMALIVLFYSLLSGDTLFSVPQFIIACLLVQSQLSVVMPAGQDAPAR